MSEISTISKNLRVALTQLRRKNFEKMIMNCTGRKKVPIQVLMLIESMGENVTSTQLAKKLSITTGAVTHNIKELRRKGFVGKEVSTVDRRVHYIKISKKGKEYIKEIEKEQDIKMLKLVNTIGVDDSKKLIEIINKIINISEI